MNFISYFSLWHLLFRIIKAIYVRCKYFRKHRKEKKSYPTLGHRFENLNFPPKYITISFPVIEISLTTLIVSSLIYQNIKLSLVFDYLGCYFLFLKANFFLTEKGGIGTKPSRNVIESH